MRILIVEDDPITRRMLEVQLVKWAYDIVSTGDGKAAWQALQQPQAPSLAIIDWMMPEMNGLELCRRIRERESIHAVYLIFLTTNDSKAHVVQGLQAGADDYLVKPCDPEELHARIRYCKKIRDDQASWQQLESYLADHSDAEFSHGVCPECYEQIVKPEMDATLKKIQSNPFK